MEGKEEMVRVLVIEDSPDDQHLLIRQLRKSQMDSHVKFISDGQEALEYLTSASATIAKNIIAIFLDLSLPSLSGVELLQRLRREKELENLPVIVMTSSNNPKDLEECRRLNVLTYVTKPVTFQSFSKAVANIFHLNKSDSQ